MTLVTQKTVSYSGIPVMIFVIILNDTNHITPYLIMIVILLINRVTNITSHRSVSIYLRSIKYLLCHSNIK